MKNKKFKNETFANSNLGGGILNNKAFTLIELLAIIVILAIIAVITVPIILNIIENSRKGAATDSAYGYKDSVNKTYVAELQNHNKLKLEGTYTVNSDGSLTPADENTDFNDDEITRLSVSVSGTIPSSGSLKYENNVLKSGWLVIGDYKVEFKSNGTVTTTKNTGSSNTTPSNPYLTRFDGNYTYEVGEGEEFDELDNEWEEYYRTDGTTQEVCMVCGSGQTGTVCITSSYYNSNYSSADSYESDFEDVNETTYNITTDVGLAATGLKGYSLAKAEEMLSKGANLCDVNSDYVSCNYNAYSSRCSIQNDGSVSCYGDSAQCDVNKGGGHYCGH